MARHLIAVFIIIAVCHVAYWNSLDTPFQFDDSYQIAGNVRIRNLADPVTIWEFSPRRFVLMYTYALNYAVGGADTWNYHYTNLLIHAANAVLLFFVGRLVLGRLMRIPPGERGKAGSWSRPETAAFLGALFFVLHPMLTEGVTYISGRSSSLCTMFALASLLAYLHGRAAESSLGAAACIALGTLSCILAMMTKELAAAIPFLILLVEYFCFRRRREKPAPESARRKAVFCLAPFLGLLIIIVAYAAYRLAVFGRMTRDEGYFSIEYALTQFTVIPRYLAALAFPVSLNIDHTLPLKTSLDAEVAGGMILVAALLAAALVLARRRRPPRSCGPNPPEAWEKRPVAAVISFAVLWMFIALLPTSSVLFLRDAMAERRMYLPFAGVFLLFGFALSAALEGAGAPRAAGLRRVLPCVPVFVLMCVFGFMTVRRNMLYEDRLRLWLDVRSKAPHSYRAAHSCGLGWLERALEGMRRGRPDVKNAALWNARLAFWDADRLNPEIYDTYLSLSDLEILREDFAGALRYAALARLFAEQRREYRVKVYSRVVRGRFFRGAELFKEARDFEAMATKLERAGRRSEAAEPRRESRRAYSRGRDNLLDCIALYDRTFGRLERKKRAGSDYLTATEYCYAAHQLLGFYYAEVEFNSPRQRYHSKKWLDHLIEGRRTPEEERFASQFLHQWIDKVLGRKGE